MQIKLDTVVMFLLAVISLELNVPYVLDQLHFHNAMPQMGFVGQWICPGGADNPLVLMGNLFKPCLLMIRTLTLFLALIWFLLDLLQVKKQVRNVETAVITLLLVGSHVVFPATMLIRARLMQNNHALAHDGGTIQMEEAMKMVVQGRNPYTETFHGTPLENWRGFTNNVVYHVPYMPGAFVYSLPAFALGKILIHTYDQRMLYLILFLCCFGLCQSLCREPVKRNLMWLVLGLNPFFIRYFVLGANDIVPVFFLLLAVVLFQKRRVTTGFLALAAACAVKQFAWFFVPFLAIAALDLTVEHPREMVRNTLARARLWSPGLALFLLTVLPFFIWNPGDFIDDTFRYGSGGLPTSYPMQGFHGFGFASLLLFFRIVPDGNGDFPFIFIQAAIVLPLMFFFLKRGFHQKIPVVTALNMSTALLFTFMFFSRYLHGNFVGFIMLWPVIAFAMNNEAEVL